MTNATAMPRTEDLFSVGSRISWGAILGGGLVSLALYFMFATLGAAVGLSVEAAATRAGISGRAERPSRISSRHLPVS